jgi:uncharacterized protein (DUF2062 family)
VLRRLWNERVAAPVTASLRRGLTPEGIALSLAFGVAVGLFPVVGTTTLLGLALGSALRLNLPVLQVANWATYPLQLALVLPLVRLGERLAGVPPATLSAAHLVAHTSAQLLGSLERFAVSGLHGVLGWMAVLPIVILVVYRTLLPILQAAEARVRPSGSGPADSPDAAPFERR